MSAVTPVPFRVRIRAPAEPGRAGPACRIGHVGLYIGNGLVIHAPHPGTDVEIAAVSTMPLVSYARP